MSRGETSVAEISVPKSPENFRRTALCCENIPALRETDALYYEEVKPLIAVVAKQISRRNEICRFWKRRQPCCGFTLSNRWETFTCHGIRRIWKRDFCWKPKSPKSPSGFLLPDANQEWTLPCQCRKRSIGQRGIRQKVGKVSC